MHKRYLQQPRGKSSLWNEKKRLEVRLAPRSPDECSVGGNAPTGHVAEG